MVALVCAAILAGQAPAPIDARQLTLSPAHAVAEIDASKLKGAMVRLAWSADGSEFYVQTLERDGHGNVKSMAHYIVSVATHQMKGVDREPQWASAYWGWKSGQASPGNGAMKIAVEPKQETVRATSAPTGGALARGGTADPASGSTVADVASAAENAQLKTTYTLKIGGDVIGEWVNEAVLPGVNFSWAPAPMNAIVFAKPAGGPLFVLDAAGRRQELEGARTAVLPAWSADGARVAWLERKDKKKYELMVAEIAAK